MQAAAAKWAGLSRVGWAHQEAPDHQALLGRLCSQLLQPGSLAGQPLGARLLQCPAFALLVAKQSREAELSKLSGEGGSHLQARHPVLGTWDHAA